MRYLSVCSGIEAATCAWHPLGWEPFAFSEIDRFPAEVLAHHYPTVPNLGDMTKFKDWPDAALDLLVGGTPCQSFSVAGLRKGLADPRGNLMLTYLAIAERYAPKWLVWENVPGVLSSNEGRDFGTLLGGMAELGYGFAYRVLDAQYIRVESHARAVPQRRRRVFVVGHLGDWRRAAAVLFERESLLGHPAPRRQAGEGVAPTLSARTKGGGGLGTDFDCDGGLVAGTLDASFARLQGCSGQDANHGHSHLIAFDTTQMTSAANRSSPKSGDPCHPLTAGSHAPAIAFNWQGGGTQTTLGYDPDAGTAGTLVKDQVQAIANAKVRRLTPRECERLQGFQDDYTAIMRSSKAAADGLRYKALGNSMAVNAMRWIGDRIRAAAAI